jgi:hypothetical protein
MNGLEIDTTYGSLRAGTLNGGRQAGRQAGQTGFSHDEVVRYP